MALTRSYWFLIVALAYVCFAAAQSRAGILPWLCLLLLPFALAEVWRRTQSAIDSGEDRLITLRAVRVACWGFSVALAARAGASGNAALEAAANLGIGATVVAALVALSRLPGPGGLVEPGRLARSLDAAIFSGVLWGMAIAVPLAKATLPPWQVDLDSVAINYVTTSASIGSLLVLIAATLRFAALRKLELGVGDRARGAWVIGVTAFLIAVPATALDVSAPDRLLPAAVAISSLFCVWVVATPEPTYVSAALRGILAVSLLGSPVTLLTVYWAKQEPNSAGEIVLLGAFACVVVGLVARNVARPFGPEQSRWLLSLERASQKALDPEPEPALTHALDALNEINPPGGVRPEIWQRSPGEVLAVDVAGYLHREPGDAPERLYDLALGEPERTLRREALEAVSVRRPEVRPLIAWFEARGAFSATLILDQEGPTGFILMPTGRRSAPLSLEEARALSALADRISALLAVGSALSRARERELVAMSAKAQADAQAEYLKQRLFEHDERQQAVAERAARQLRATAFSPAAKTALEQLERLAQTARPIQLDAAPGNDVLGYAAHIHLCSARAKGPFVVIDSTTATETAFVNRPTPFELAAGGSLLILDVGALSVTNQELLASALGVRTLAPEHEFGLIVSVRANAPREGKIVKALQHWLPGERVLKLPTLAERPEDLRGLALETLTRAGMAETGHPFGIDRSALMWVSEHPWVQNELELVTLLSRAACFAEGPLVSLRHIEQALGLKIQEKTAPAPETESETRTASLISSPSQRPRPRRTPRHR